MQWGSYHAFHRAVSADRVRVFSEQRIRQCDAKLE
jgi:hypothetical protein